MIKPDLFTPALCIVALSAFFALLALVYIIDSMAAVAVTGEFLFVGIRLVAGLAGNPGVVSL